MVIQDCSNSRIQCSESTFNLRILNKKRSFYPIGYPVYVRQEFQNMNTGICLSGEQCQIAIFYLKNQYLKPFTMSSGGRD